MSEYDCKVKGNKRKMAIVPLTSLPYAAILPDQRIGFVKLIVEAASYRWSGTRYGAELAPAVRHKITSEGPASTPGIVYFLSEAVRIAAGKSL